MSGPWSRMDQLLKCGVCSNKYRNPKLLPCNHTYCSEPCLDKLVERSKQQLKCPECSAEHRVPHGGVQSFPNNVTLVRFLELRQQVSGREPDLPPSMQRCNTCKEKGQLEVCAHCNRKVCKDCKTAHVNILRKEIGLINEQVRQGLQQLSGILHRTEEKADKLQKNYTQVKDEIEEVVRRYSKDLFQTEAKLKHDLDSYLQTELGSIQRLEHDLQVEMTNVNSNCDLVDKYVNNGVDWTDAELTDYKEIFLKTIDFLRTFDSDPTDCLRKIKFHPRADPDVVHKTLVDFAEVKLNYDSNNNAGANNDGVNGNFHGSSPSLTLTPPQSNAIARSQSDNRLANQRQFQKTESSRSRNEDSERDTSYTRRRFTRDKDSCEREVVSSRGEDRDHLTVSSWRRELDEARGSQRNRFASREYLDEVENYEKESSPSRRGVRFEDRQPGHSQKGKDHVTETQDATKGPLSGVIKILDNPHVMERLHHSEVRQKKLKEEEERKARQPPPPPLRVTRPINRQLSEDEIEKQKKENKAAAAAAAAPSTNTTATAVTPKTNSSSDTYTRSRVSHDDDSRSFSSRLASYRTSTEDHGKSTSTKSSEDTSTTSSRRKTSDETVTSTPRLTNWRTATTNEKDHAQSPPGSPTRYTSRDTQKPPVSPRQRETVPSTRPFGRSYLTKTSSLDNDDRPAESSPPLPQRRTLESVGRTSSLDQRVEKKSRPNLRLGIPQNTEPAVDSSGSSSSESESSADSDTATRRGDISPSVNTLLQRSAQARKQSASTQARLLGRQDDDKRKPPTRSWRDAIKKEDEPAKDTSSSRRRLTTTIEPEERTSAYSRMLSDRRRSSLASSTRFGNDDGAEDRFRTGDSSYSSSAARRNRISRSKSSHDLLPGDDSPDEDSITAIRNRYRTRKSRDKSPEETAPTSWSQYLKNKYGSNRSSGTASSSNALVRSRTSSGLANRSGSDNSSDEDSLSRRRDFRRHGDSNSPRGFSLPRRTYMAKGKPTLKIGSRGTEQGHFTWPRGVCVGSENTIVVADSSNHRIQVFHSTGKVIQEFGSYGSNEGEFDCLAAVTVNRIGQFIVSDRYNHRVQVFDPSGRFVRSFGCEGRGEGKFSYPWGIATDNLGFIYVCDKENHRVQVFQGDGTYVTKFGSIGQRAGELEHPHYVAVSTTNRVIVSDSNNHRIQIFDVNGRLLSTFGNEGSDEGQFKYPRGVAVDDQGYLIVGDSGNNRIQVFHPDGTFLKAFGTWGSGDGEFKGLEGVAVTPSGQILVCDRENHRIQVF